MTDIVFSKNTDSMNGTKIFKWTGLANGATGAPLRLPAFPDKTVQVYGTFGSGGSITIEGSNDNLGDASPNFATCHKIDNSALTFSTAGICELIENPNLIRPHVTAGDGTTSLTVIICAKGDGK